MPSKPRTPIFDGLDAVCRDSLINKGDYSYEKRRGGSDSDEKTGGGQRRTTGSGPLMEPDQWVMAAMCSQPVIDETEYFQDLMDEDAAGNHSGRRPEFRGSDMAAFRYTRRFHDSSLRMTERLLSNPRRWEELRAEQIKAHPDLPERLRLSENPPSQWQFLRFRAKYLDDETEEALGDIIEENALKAARHMGLLNKTRKGKTSTATNPHRTQFVAGDSTQHNALYRARTATTTGPNPRPRRCDEGAICPANEGQRRYDVLFASVREEKPCERIVLIARRKPRDKREAVAVTEKILDLREKHPDMLQDLAGVAFDMDMRDSECDLLLSNNLLPVCKVARTNKNLAAAIDLGKLEFTRNGETKAILPVTAIDGTPTIAAIDTDGVLYDQPLQLVKIQAKTNTKNQTIVYTTYKIPDSPFVPRRHVGLRVRIRQNSTSREINSKMPRTRALRVYGEGTDPRFAEYFGVREDPESINNHFKSTQHNRRAQCINEHPVQFDLFAYQTAQTIVGLLAHHARTGADIKAWFGNYKPPL